MMCSKEVKCETVFLIVSVTLLLLLDGFSLACHKAIDLHGLLFMLGSPSMLSALGCNLGARQAF